jgi:sodium transport system permease protein
MKNQALYVYRKELRELLRDRRVRTSAILGPFLMVFLMISTMGGAVHAATQAHSQKIHVVNPKGDNPLLSGLKAAGVDLVSVASMDEGRQLVEKGKAALVLQFPDDFMDDVARGQTATINAIYDDKAERSQMAERSVEKAVDEMNKNHIKALLASASIPASGMEQFKVKGEDVMAGKGANELLLMLIPYLVVFLAFVGGVSAASDLIAGEKERNTLETLLISPVPRTKVVLGKFLALASICLFSSMSGLLGILLASGMHLPGSDELFKNGIGIGPVAVGSIVLVMLPTVALFASVLIAVSAYAKNTREAQTYMSLGSILVALPSIFSQFLGFTDFGSSRWINAIPVLNASSAIRNALTGRLDATSLALTAGLSAGIALIGILIAVRLCNREQVLLRV